MAFVPKHGSQIVNRSSMINPYRRRGTSEESLHSRCRADAYRGGSAAHEFRPAAARSHFHG
jgi:hypothetical protein